MAIPDFSRVHPASHSPPGTPTSSGYPQLPPSVAAQIAAIVHNAVPSIPLASSASLENSVHDAHDRLRHTEERLAATEQRLQSLTYATRVQAIIVAAAAVALAGSVWLGRRAP